LIQIKAANLEDIILMERPSLSSAKTERTDVAAKVAVEHRSSIHFVFPSDAIARQQAGHLLSTMRFCDAELCPSCPLAGNKPACLRQKAEFCLWLTARTSNRGLRAGVEKMRIALLKEAEALEKERSLASSIRSPSCRPSAAGRPA
jgi:hypothetical protein